MRPLLLEMSAFGPYAGTEKIDFDALTELGLFVVAGTNGSGKTTIFDALHYSLYGNLPGRRVGYTRLRSDHADKRAECRVTLDFFAKGHRWRVERSPRQRRPKRRGDGYTEVEHRATLFRLQGDHPVAVANKIGEVDERCRDLVGLSGPQFERVALLPQGEFSRVLAQSSTERRELLRTLFSSEVFGDATRLLTEQAAHAVAGERLTLERLDAEQASAAAEIAALATELAAPAALDCHDRTNQRDAAETVAVEIGELRDALRELRDIQLGELQQQVDRRTAVAAQAANDLQLAVAGSGRFDRRTRVQAALDTHRGNQAQHDRDVARLARARAAVPVAGQARAAIQQQQRHAQAGQHVDELRERVNGALARAGLPKLMATTDAALAQSAQAATWLGERLAVRRDAALRAADLELAVTGLQRELRRRTNDAATLAEQMRVARTRSRQGSNELESLARTPDLDRCTHELQRRNHELEQRLALARLDTEQQRLIDAESELVPVLESLRHQHDRAQQAQVAIPRLHLEERLAVDTLAECERRLRALETSIASRERLVRLRADYERSRSNADRCWDAFVTGTAPRIAATLVDDEPCPVCGSPEHPDPAQPTSGQGLVTQAEVGAARAGADRVLAELRRVENEIELLVAADADLGTVTSEQLSAELEAATTAAVTARTEAERAQHAAAGLHELTTQLQSAQADLAAIETERHAVTDERNRCVGSLAELADEPVDTVRDRAKLAEQQLTQAEHKSERAAHLQGLLAELERTIDTIGLEQITAENRRVSIGDQLGDRQRELDTAVAELTSLDAELAAELGPAVAPRADDHEQSAQATRHALELLAQLTTAAALRADAAAAQRRAESILRERLEQSPFAQIQEALDASIDAEVIVQLEAQTTGFTATADRLLGQLHELDDVPAERPDLDTARLAAEQAGETLAATTRRHITLVNRLERLESSVTDLERRRATLQRNDLETRRLERVAALVKGDNDRNTSLENWVLAAHLRDVVELANVRLAGSTGQRFQLCVLDDGENRRGRWGLDLGVEDTVTGTRRPTAGLSGGELFQASLALALGLADAVMNQTAGVHIDALFIDEGFGSLDENSVERAIDLLDELRDRGAMIGVITHVPALLEALPRGITVVSRPGGHGSTIRQAA